MKSGFAVTPVDSHGNKSDDRAKAMSLATFLNRVTATSTFLSAKNVLTWGGYFLVLALFCALIFIFFHCYLPETSGRSLEDMSIYFAEITGG